MRSVAEYTKSTCRRTSSENAASDRHSVYSRKSCWSVRLFTHWIVTAAAQTGQGKLKIHFDEAQFRRAI